MADIIITLQKKFYKILAHVLHFNLAHIQLTYTHIYLAYMSDDQLSMFI